MFLNGDILLTMANNFDSPHAILLLSISITNDIIKSHNIQSISIDFNGHEISNYIIKDSTTIEVVW